MMKTIKVLSLGLGLTAFLGLPAFADQCAWVSKQQALLVLSRLEVGQTISHLCEPCGETRPQRVIIESLSASTVDASGSWQVKVNDKSIDLAYVFIESGIGNQPINLAAVAGCSASDVSPVLPSNRRGVKR